MIKKKWTALKRWWWTTRGFVPIETRFIHIHKVGTTAIIDRRGPYLIKALDPPYTLWGVPEKETASD